MSDNDSRLDAALASICERGYWWYFTLKVGKAAVAIPLFLFHACWLVPLSIIAYTWASIIQWKALPSEVWAYVQNYWARRWFSGFSKGHYESLYRRADTGDTHG